MKRGSLVLVAALAGCSPVDPTPMDVQLAVESYYLAHAISADANRNIIISCAPISEMAGGNSDGKLARVRFRFHPADGRSDGDRAIYAVALRQGGRGWYIPFEAKLENLPCQATKVGGLQDST